MFPGTATERWPTTFWLPTVAGQPKRPVSFPCARGNMSGVAPSGATIGKETTWSPEAGSETIR